MFSDLLVGEKVSQEAGWFFAWLAGAAGLSLLQPDWASFERPNTVPVTNIWANRFTPLIAGISLIIRTAPPGSCLVCRRTGRLLLIMGATKCPAYCQIRALRPNFPPEVLVME